MSSQEKIFSSLSLERERAEKEEREERQRASERASERERRERERVNASTLSSVPVFFFFLMFGCVFVGHSFLIDSSCFVQTSPTNWVLHVTTSVTPNYLELKEVSLFLTRPDCLPPQAALGVYVSTGGTDWAYRGKTTTHFQFLIGNLSIPNLIFYFFWRETNVYLCFLINL